MKVKPAYFLPFNHLKFCIDVHFLMLYSYKITVLGTTLSHLTLYSPGDTLTCTHCCNTYAYLVTLILVEQHKDYSHHSHHCQDNESIDNGLPCLGGSAVRLLMEWSVNPAQFD